MMKIGSCYSYLLFNDSVSDSGAFTSLFLCLAKAEKIGGEIGPVGSLPRALIRFGLHLMRLQRHRICCQTFFSVGALFVHKPILK